MLENSGKDLPMKSFGDVFIMSRLGKANALSSLRKGPFQAATLSCRTALFGQPLSFRALKKRSGSPGSRSNNVVRNHSMFTQAGDDESGHLNTRPGEGIFFLDSMYYIPDVGA